MLLMLIRKSLSMRSATATNSLPAAVIATRRVHAENILNAFDGSGQGRLRRLQESGCSDEAVVFRHSKNGMELTGGQIGDGGAHRFMHKMELKLIMEIY
jgi:hypothetical protein